MGLRDWGIALLLAGLVCTSMQAQGVVRPQFRVGARSLVTTQVDRTRTVPTQGAVSRRAAQLPDLGEADDALPIEHIQLLLRRTPERQAAFDAQVEALHTAGSASYHQWLTPETIGSEFGPSAADLATLTAYLGGEGFTVDHVGKGGLYVDFTGTAAQVKSSFRTSIHNLRMATGEVKYSAVQDASIPEALAPLVAGFVSLSNIPIAHTNFVKNTTPATALARASGEQPLDTVGSTDHVVGPQDFYTIYNEAPLIASGTVPGAGVTIALLEESAIVTSDVTYFRNTFNVLPNTPVSLVVGTGYGSNTCTAPAALASSGEEGEAVLDIEWTSAVAPGANLIFMQCATASTQGILLSAEAVVDNNLADIMSLSYGGYEGGANRSADRLVNELWEQAAAQGETVVVSAGDNGAAIEDGNDEDAVAKYGITANGLATTAWNVAAGGTDFMDTFNDAESDSTYGVGTFWSATNGPGLSSAMSYVPEMTWNDTCGSSIYSYYYYQTVESDLATLCGANVVPQSIVAGGSAPSTLHARPSWQNGTVYGLPTIAAQPNRMVPDVSLFASNGFWGHSLPVYESDNGGFSYAGGTSFVAPQLAGVFAVIKQSTQERLGQPNYVLYAMAGIEFGTSSYTANNCNGSGSNTTTSSPVTTSLPGAGCVFYDIEAGTNSVECASTGKDCFYVAGDSYGLLSQTASGTSGTPAYWTNQGWDLATGIGSLNIANLVSNWQSTTNSTNFTPTVAVTASAASAPYGSTAAITYTATVSGSGSFPTGTVAFSGSPAIGTIGTDTLVPSSACRTGGTCVESTTQAFTPGTLAAGNYTITANYSGVNENYISGAGSAALTIFLNPSTITFSIPSPQHTIDPTVALSASSNGSGAFTYSVVSGPATISGSTLTLTGAGTVVVQVTQAADSTYSLTTKQATFTVLAGSVWVGNSGGSLSALDLLGNVLSPSGGFSGGGLGTIPAALAIAFDSTGDLWVASSNGISEFAKNGSAITSSAYTTGGIANPRALAVDGAGTVWIANATGPVSALSNAGDALSPSGGFTGAGSGTPGGVAVDISGNVWVTNSTASTLTEFLGAGSPVLPLAAAAATGSAATPP